METAPRAVPMPFFAAAALVAAAAAGTAAATLRNPLLAVAAVLVAAFVGLALRNIVGAVAVFIVCTFVEQLPGAGSGVTLVKGLGAVIVFAWVIALLRGTLSLHAAAGARAPVVLGAVGLVVVSLASAAWAADPGTAVDAALRLGQGAVLAVALVTCLPGRRALELAVLGFVAGASLSAVLGLAGVGAAAAAPTATARVGGGLADPNYLAAVLVPGVFFALGLRGAVAGRGKRLLLLAAPVVMVAALFRTESRGGVVALGASVLAGLVFGGRLRRQVVAAALAVVVAGAVYFAASPSPHRILSFGAGGGSGRTELWSVASQVFRAHPVGGVGAGNFSVVEPSYAVRTTTNLTKPYQELTLREVVHNTYLHVLAELGIVGLVLLLLLVVGATWLGIRAAGAFARRGEHQLEALTRGLVVGGVGMFAAFGFLTAQYEKQLWVVIGLLGAAHAIAAAGVRIRPRDASAT